MTLAPRDLAIAALAACAVAGGTAAPPVIVGGPFIDGTGRPPLPDGVIVSATASSSP